MRVGLEHLGQSVLLLVSMTFLRSPVLAILAIMLVLPGTDISAHAPDVLIDCFPARGMQNRTILNFSKDCPGLATGNRLEKNCDRGSAISLHDSGYCGSVVGFGMDGVVLPVGIVAGAGGTDIGLVGGGGIGATFVFWSLSSGN